MGTARWDATDWKSYTTTVVDKKTEEIFTSRKLNEDLNPKGIVVRESRDSEVNPESTAIIIGVDVTGSMGIIADYFVRTGLGVLFEHILAKKPVSDPHLMFMGIGDATVDDAPLQVSQFEADISIVDQLEKVYIEHGGGGNVYESYEMPWYFAAYHTSIDCYEKRGKRGYLFTIGDEMPSKGLIKEQIKRVSNVDVQSDISLEELYEQVSRMYNTYHIIIAEGSYARYRLDNVKEAWTNIIGQNAIVLDDYKKLSEVIESIIEVNEGVDKDAVVKSWSGDTSLVVKNSIKDLKYTDPSLSTDVVIFD